MLYTRSEISKKYSSTYQVNKALENNELYNIQNAKNNWLEIQIDDVLSNIFIFFNNLR